jgi:DNA mismatch repair protein MutS
MGDFYELFHDDAVTASRELGLTLTSRSKGDDAMPMAGVPVRAAEGYLMKLVDKGHKVAICEQVEDPRTAKGIVDRAIVRVVTAGTITEETSLDARRSNWLACLHPARRDDGNGSCGLAWVDLSTGRFLAAELPAASVADEVGRIGPAELIWSESVDEHHPELAAELRHELGPRVGTREPWRFERDAMQRAVERHFKVQTLEGYGFEQGSPVVPAAGALIEYVEETQKQACEHILRIEKVDAARHLVLDRATRSCLELTETQREGRREGTLLDTIDATRTPMGGRLLREWLLAPLRDVETIVLRQRAVGELVEGPFLREELRDLLSRVLDVERLVAKVATGRANARDLLALCRSLEIVAPLREKLDGAYSAELGARRDGLDPLEDVVARIATTIADDPPVTLREGGLIRAGFSEELDDLRRTAGDGKSGMARFQAAEVERTGIQGLKIGFNSVFGYYVEVPRAQAARAPEHYVRKQTVKSGERYVTPELKEFETKVLKAEELALDLELELFGKLRDELAGHVERILATAAAIAHVDVYAALAQKAAENRYVQPVIDDGDTIRIVDGRHPVIERNARGEAFVPNDSRLNRSDRMLTILTGPNMAGKSTYIRQTALIVLLAQIGSFVPAAEAKIGVVDRIFTRIGSADDIGRGTSTFMVEMLEIANILNNASARSLIVLDEVGRGTSTFDGLALAWAIVEHVHERIRARTLFATHYHQLTELASRLPGVCNRNVAVREWNDEIVFLHKIVEGGTDRSYGLHVARLAGVPKELVDRAQQILRDIAEDAQDLAPRIAGRPEKTGASGPSGPQQLGLFERKLSEIEKELAGLDVDRLTPIEALTLLAGWKKRVE